MSATHIPALTVQVLSAAFAVAVLYGAVAQRTHFCTMGALSDVVHMGDWTRVRQWALAVGLAMVGFAVLGAAGWVDPDQTLYASPRWMWLSGLVGGGLFGFGMVLASGCGGKTLVRIGGGSLKSVVVFLVMGFAAFATLKGITAVLRVASVDRVAIEFAGGADLPRALSALAGIPLPSARLALGLALGGGLVLWALAGRGFANQQNLLAGLGIGGAVILMWAVSGTLGHVPEHPDTLQETYLATNSRRAEAFSFVAPAGYALDWLMYYSDSNKSLTVGVVAVAGVVLGAALAAWQSGSFHWEGFRDVEDLAHHLSGAVAMGIGGVTALGCTVGQGLSGLSTLSATSFVAVLGIVLGALAGFRYQRWRLECAA